MDDAERPLHAATQSKHDPQNQGRSKWQRCLTSYSYDPNPLCHRLLFQCVQRQEKTAQAIASEGQ